MARSHHACARARSRTRGDLPRAGGYMRKLQFGMTALALVLLGFSLARFVGGDGKPVTVHLAPQASPPRVPPGEAGIDPAALNAAAEFAAKHHTRALGVGRNGHIVFEEYWGDTRFDSAVETGF